MIIVFHLIKRFISTILSKAITSVEHVYTFRQLSSQDYKSVCLPYTIYSDAIIHDKKIRQD